MLSKDIYIYAHKEVRDQRNLQGRGNRKRKENVNYSFSIKIEHYDPISWEISDIYKKMLIRVK